MIKVIIADDHKLFRQGIAVLLEDMEDVSLIDDVDNGNELLAALKDDLPDIVLLDLDMPGKNGIEVLEEIRQQYAELGVIILTAVDVPMVPYLDICGANGYLFKSTSHEEVENAIRSVYREGFYFNKSVSQAMLGSLKKPQRKKPTLKNNVTLSNREVEVLELICQEYTAKEIGEKLFISPRTAEGHRRHLIEKLGVKNTAGLIVKAIKEGIVDI